MHALIAGAGIGGLAAAVALRREGLDVTVIERAPALTEVGAGVVLGAHAMRALDFLGAADHVRALNQPPEQSIYYDMISGDARFVTTLGEAGRDLYGAKTYTTHRRDLIDALAGQLSGATLRLGSTLAALDQDADGVSVTLADGDTVRGDLLIGADGLRSTVRTALFGESEAVFTGFLAWRTVRPIEAVGRSLEPTTGLWIGAGRHIVCYPIRKGTQFYAAFYVPAGEIHREDWSVSGDVAELRASFADACPEVRHLTESIDEAFITGIYYRDPLPCWRKGRVVLLGDAAHPVLPTSGSGAAVALEDAVAIAGCLRRHGARLEDAFAEFEARRKPRTTRLLLSSRADLTTYHESNPVKIAATGPMNFGIRQLDPTGYQRMAWLYAYDEPAESAKPFELFDKSMVAPPARPEARNAFERWSAAIGPEDSIDGWLSERAAYNRFIAALGEPPAGTQVESVDCDGVAALRVVPPGGEDGPAVLHLHGGGYVYGSASASAALAARIAKAVGGWALVPDYRLAPEHDAAAMQADVRTAHGWLAARAGRLFVSGECAGGGLAIALIAALRDADMPVPDAAYLLSPFLDMRLKAPSIDGNAAHEPWLSRRRLLQLAGSYIQTDRPDDPRLSPLLGSLSGFPPLRIFAAADESLADDARGLQAAAVAAGVDTRMTLIEDSVHSFALFETLPETRQFLVKIAAHATALAGGSRRWTA